MPPGLSVLLNSKGQFLIAQGSARSGPKTGCAQMPIPRITPHNNIVFFRCLFRLMCYYYVLLADRLCRVRSGSYGKRVDRERLARARAAGAEFKWGGEATR